MAKTTNDKSKDATATAAQAGGLKKYFNLTQDEKISYSIVLALVFLIVLIRSKFYEIPFERDEGAYSYYGKLLLEGKVPYKDFYEQKFPGIFYFFAMIVAIFGDTVKGMHMGFMVVNILTMLFLFFASKRLFSPLAGVITAVTFSIVSLTPGLSGFTVQGEHAVAFFTSIGLFFYSYTVTHKHWKYSLLMGLAFGCAFMTKTSGMFLALWGGIVTITDFYFTKEKRPFKELLIKGLIYSAGVLFVIGFMFSLILLKGSFNEMLFWTLEIPQKYVNKIQWEQGKTYLDYMYKAITADYKFFWAHAFFALIFIFFKNIKGTTRVAMLTLLGFSCITIFPGYYFYGHYWIQILPGLSILAGFMFFAINTTLSNRFGIKWSKLPYAYLAIFIVVSFMHLNKKKDYYFNPNYDRILRSVYGNNPFPEAMGISNYINANSKPEDGIVVMGSEPQIYFYTKKKCPSRHAYFAAIVDNVPEHKQWQREFVADVEKAAPKYFVFFNHQISLFVQPGTDQYVFEWYNKYIQNYNLIGCVDMVDGYASTYAWKEQLANFKPQSQSVVYIYERKP
ncbi:MAG: glycosyltransferase family 39 protein [Bacteroidia bacterium]|nr:glycosyltransferase family 39 protein [Bacteroidia bacterium]